MPAMLAASAPSDERLIELLCSVPEAVGSATGPGWIDRVAAALASALEADFVLIGETLTERRVRTLSLWTPGGHAAMPVTYDLAGTPCASVMDRSVCVFPDHVQQLFPRDHLLVEMEAEAYAGSPLRTSDDVPIGVLAALWQRPCPNSQRAQQLLNLVSARVSVELERTRHAATHRAVVHQLQGTLDAVPDPITVIDLNLDVVYQNAAAGGAVIQRPHRCHEVVRGGTRPGPGPVCPLARTLATGEACTAEHELDDGRVLEVHTAPLRHLDGTIWAVVETVKDLSEQRAVESRLRAHSAHLSQLAHHDPLTGLANRTLLMEHLPRALDRARAQGTTLAVLFIDLDGFKSVNDELGHSTGDETLQAVADRTRRTLRSADLVSRLGGDEFVAVLENVRDADHAVEIAKKLAAAIRAPISLGEAEPRSVTASVGVALYPDHGERAERLLIRADAAMYEAKGAGRDAVRLATSRADTEDDDAFARELVEAFRADALELYYLPAITLDTGTVAGVEALLRWRHPVRGLLRPDALLGPLAEHGLMVELGDWVVGRALDQMVAWRAAGCAPHWVSVNLGVQHLRIPTALDGLSRHLERTGLPPGALEVEIAEPLLAGRPGALQPGLGRLRDLGVRVVLDDYGTGNAGPVALHALPFDRVKIDGRVFRASARSDRGHALVRALAGASNGLGLALMAEGVETPDLARIARALQCSCAQGHLYAAPMNGPDATDWLKRMAGTR